MTTDTLPRVSEEPPAAEKTPNRRRRWVLIVLAVLLVAGVGARTWWPSHAADIRDGTTAVDAQGMAAHYGVDVSLIGVTAAGGLIELRYQVVDPDKASPIIHDAALSPALVVEDSGATLRMASPPHHHTDLRLGGTYFFLMANANNAIHSGDLVTLVIGDVRLEHIRAQG